jgi:hypothetical protein
VFPIPDLPERHVLGEGESGRVDLAAEAARELFSRPAFAASTEASRLYLNGVFLHNAGDFLSRGRHGWIPALPSHDAGSDHTLDPRSLIIPNPMVKTSSG